MDESYAMNNKKIQLEDIAYDLKLSKSTISRAISGKGRISTETRRLVNEYISEHGYSPNIIARSLAQSKSFNIGIALPKSDSEIPFFHNCILGACGTALTFDYDAVITLVGDDDITFLKKMVENRKVDGVILTRAIENDPAAEYLMEKEIPFVLIGASDDSDITCVDNDHISACAKLTDYLLGFCESSKTALILGSMRYIVNKKRYSGFKKAFADRGLEVRQKLIKTGLSNPASIEKEISEMLNCESGCPDCIICGDDYICEILLSVLNSREISVPHRVKVASFYNSVYFNNYRAPVISIEFDAKEIGSAAAQTLIRMINNENAEKRRLLGYKLAI